MSIYRFPSLFLLVNENDKEKTPKIEKSFKKLAVEHRSKLMFCKLDISDDLAQRIIKLSNIIIVDNMPQNYRLQPENGILIKPFWGKDNNDDVLFSLSKILCKIAEKNGQGLYGWKN